MNEIMIKHYSALVGKKITAVAMDDSKGTVADFGEPLFGLQFDDDSVAWIFQDPEGNGPGFLSIEENN